MKLIPFVSALVAIGGSLWSPAPAGAQNPQRSLLRQLYGDLAFEVRTRGQGTVTLAAADARTQVVITLMSTDLRRWSDSATRMLGAAPPRGRSVSWNALVEGPGVVAGSMSLTRSIAPGDTNLILLVTDTAFKAIRTTLTMTDAKALAAAMKRAALASLPTRPAPMPATKAPATKTPPAPLPKKPPLS